ncbi:MAG: hypothetical protein M1399_03545 [Actinobacteria bacterium]|nr:hypothetical protein [Actinomycetota bacterium]MCL5446049.1 hypothetical protein [Actinomycetota bacterium]
MKRKRISYSIITAYLIGVGAVIVLALLAAAGTPGSKEMLITAGVIAGLIFLGTRLHGMGDKRTRPDH